MFLTKKDLKGEIKNIEIQLSDHVSGSPIEYLAMGFVEEIEDSEK